MRASFLSCFALSLSLSPSFSSRFSVAGISEIPYLTSTSSSLQRLHLTHSHVYAVSTTAAAARPNDKSTLQPLQRYVPINSSESERKNERTERRTLYSFLLPFRLSLRRQWYLPPFPPLPLLFPGPLERRRAFISILGSELVERAPDPVLI